MVKTKTTASPQLTRIYGWFTAIGTEDTTLMDDLLTHGLEIDVPHPLRHTTALMEATRQGRTALVSWLLARGAAPAFPCGLPRGTALHCALSHRNWAIARLLADACRNCGVVDAYGRTPLHILAIDVKDDQMYDEEALEIASILIAKGCQLDALDHEGITALHYCVINDYLALAELLLHRGANPNPLTPDTHVSPLMIAALDKNMTMATSLLFHGANPYAKTREGTTPASILPALARMAEEATLIEEQRHASRWALPRRIAELAS